MFQKLHDESGKYNYPMRQFMKPNATPVDYGMWQLMAWTGPVFFIVTHTRWSNSP